jgi:ketol-acid reductoisomerase
MTAHSNINAIHISQMPDNWNGEGTYSNTMIYNYIPTKYNREQCMDYLMRKIRQLEKKIADGTESRQYMSRWMNQREMYQAIWNLLNLHKL